MTIQTYFPVRAFASLDDLIAKINKAQVETLLSAQAQAEAFAKKWAALLLADPQIASFPSAAAFAFWLRPASLSALCRQISLEDKEGRSIKKPIGTVFLMPPSNVATLFAYMAFLSLLCGNVTLVRLPGMLGETQSFLLNHMIAALTEAPSSFQKRLFLLGYGHDDAVTTALSQSADLRMIWGADETLAHIGALPLRPLARHIGFGNRFSAAAIGAKGYLDLPHEDRETLARHLAVDLYTFDQLACASPRALFWIGTAAQARKAREDFYPRLAGAAEKRGYTMEAGKAIARRDTAFLALHDLETDFYRVYAPSLSVVGLSSLGQLEAVKGETYGFGLLFEATCATLDVVLSESSRCDQTLGIACLPVLPETAKGYDRLVPIGTALDFDVIWDGLDLMATLTRLQRRGL